MRRRLALALLSLAIVGCGPSATTLVAEKHYREALCSESDRAFVAKALWEDTNAHLHLHVVTAEEMASLIGDQPTSSIRERARIVRLTLETNRLPVDGMRVSITGEPAVITTPTWDRLAQLTHETLPPMEKRTTSLTGRNIINVGAIFFTGGLWLLTDPRWSEREYYVEPSSEKYRAQAPLAFALRDATSVGGACSGSTASANEEAPVGLFCTTYLVIDRVDPQPVDLVLSFEYVAYRWKPEQRDYKPEEKDQCLGKYSVRVPVEPMLDARPRRIADLARFVR
jgi:hypothetical protein